MKMQALLGNAALQRSAIRTSNLLFSFPCYHSFYGSHLVVVPEKGLVLPQGVSKRDVSPKVADRFIDAINDASAAYPDVNFVYQVMDDTYSTSANPSVSLLSDPRDESWTEENVIAKISPDIKILHNTIADADELSEKWFTTEHHWTIDRALEAYNEIALTLDLDIAQESANKEVSSAWYGASARRGLCLESPSTFSDLTTDFSHLEVFVDGEPAERGVRNSYLNGDLDLAESRYSYFNLYHYYYGTTLSEVVYKNTGSNNGRVLLFIEQSYGVPLEPYLATNYATTVCIDPANKPIKMPIKQYIEEYNVDDVVIQLGPVSYNHINETSPHL